MSNNYASENKTPKRSTILETSLVLDLRFYAKLQNTRFYQLSPCFTRERHMHIQLSPMTKPLDVESVDKNLNCDYRKSI